MHAGRDARVSPEYVALLPECTFAWSEWRYTR
jgi:hypothetical protein